MTESLIPLAISAALGAAGSIISGNAEANAAQAAADAQAAQLRNAAEQDRANAEMARNASMAKEEAIRRANRQKEGRMAAAMAQAGVLGSGSSMGLLDQNTAELELEALNARYEGISKSDSLLYSAEGNIINAANVLSIGDYKAQQARRGGFAGALASVGSSAAAGFAGGAFKDLLPSSSPGIFGPPSTLGSLTDMTLQGGPFY